MENRKLWSVRFSQCEFEDIFYISNFYDCSASDAVRLAIRELAYKLESCSKPDEEVSLDALQ